MVAIPLGRRLLLGATLWLAACTDFSLPRRGEMAEAETARDSASSARPTRRTATRNDSGTVETQARNFAEIRRTLRGLVVAEETFFAENGTYSKEVPLMRAAREQDIAVRFLWVSREGWAASATHIGLPDKDCVIFVGPAQAPPTTLKYGRRGRLGVPVCDDRRPPPRQAAAPPRPQAPPPQALPPSADTVSQLDLLDPRVVMKVDLRNLAHSQETYFAMQGFYARRPQSLALQYLWHRYVQVRILEADNQSWAAQATHARFPGRSCVIWFGAVAQRPRTALQQREASRAGVPACDN
jgi:hypothetical protein